jgi:uncharacterized protein (TIGR02145 family)
MKTYFLKTLQLFILLFFVNKTSSSQPTTIPLNLSISEECGERIFITTSYPYSIPAGYRIEVYLYIDRFSNNPGTVINQQFIGNLTLNNPVVNYTYTLTGYWNSDYCVKVKHKIINTQTNTQTWALVYSATKCLTLTLCGPNGIPGPPSVTAPPPSVVASNIVCKSFRVNWGTACPAKYANIEVRNYSNNAIIANINVDWGLFGYTFSNNNYNQISPGGTYIFKVRVFYNCSLSVSGQGWTPWSNSQTVTLPNNIPNAGPDKSMPVCTTGINGIYLQATAISGGKWSVVSSYPSGYTGNFLGSDTDPNAYFQFTNYGANYYTLKWGNECSSDIMIVYTSFTCGMDLIDTRDSKIYTTNSYNGKCWFTKNLNYGAQISWGGGHPSVYSLSNDASWPASNSNIVKYCLNNNNANCTAYGGLYLGDVAALSGLCPPCWHVATDAEWTNLINFAASAGNATTRLKDNTIGFNALKTNSTVSGTNPDGNLTTGFLSDIHLTRNSNGYGFSNVYFYLAGTTAISSNHNGGFDFQSAGQYNNFWTSTPYNTTTNYNTFPSRYGGTSTGWAYYRTFIAAGSLNPSQTLPANDLPPIRDQVARRNFAFHVRCVKN